ncbi:hypothetical protein NDU88_005963 [Pleurodeles waltl]|uniref:Uncharacterized protein n=1 Tax=Pleurodeles waltl TaxID=8319 RepID=A0AAV7TX20_PLEWA|nr:hypothetical protein NDU88_005963 [Pleurodeles waltl]
MAVRGSESPWRRSKLRRHGGFLRAAENRRETAGFPCLTAAVPPRGPQEKRCVENWCVRRFLLSTHLRRNFPRGEPGVVFRRADSLLLWFAGSTRCPGSVGGFSCLFSGCASFCRAARRSFDLTAGVASISPAESGGVVLARPCVKVLISRQASRRFLLESRAALSLRGRASKFWSSRRRRVDQCQCAAFFLPRNKLCVERFGARSVQEEERSLFGPETSGNRRQALSKPLESTFTARKEFSKAAGQQQGSSPL